MKEEAKVYSYVENDRLQMAAAFRDGMTPQDQLYHLMHLRKLIDDAIEVILDIRQDWDFVDRN